MDSETALKCRWLGVGALSVALIAAFVSLTWERTGYPPELKEELERSVGPESHQFVKWVFWVSAAIVGVVNAYLFSQVLTEDFQTATRRTHCEFLLGCLFGAVSLLIVMSTFTLGVWIALGKL